MANIATTGSEVFDRTGEKVGKINDVILEPTTLEPEWYELKVGLLGRKHLVPAESLTVERERCTVPFDKHAIASAPNAHIPPYSEEVPLLREHYRAA